MEDKKYFKQRSFVRAVFYTIEKMWVEVKLDLRILRNVLHEAGKGLLTIGEIVDD